MMALIVLLITLCFHQRQCQDQHMPNVQISNMTVIVDELFERLCPSVEICNLNASTAELSPNGIIRENFVSCCTGCSCHPDCKVRSNCCYPSDNNTVPSNEQPVINYKCLKAAVGKPGEALPESIEAYHTIVLPPPGGCLSKEPFELEPDLIVLPSCDDTSYFPVYSQATEEIYKNVQCALCHGVDDPEYFIPVFNCRQGGRVRTDPFSEISFLIENDEIASRCYVHFRFHDQRLLFNKRCYSSVIKSCQKERVYAVPGLNIQDLDFDTVRFLCEKGVYSPFPSDFGVFKNVFCYLCGFELDIYRELECRYDVFERADGTIFISLLDPKAYLRKGAVLRQETYPTACMERVEENLCISRGSGSERRCYKVYCPLGQTRTKDGRCVFISNYITSPLQVSLKLTPSEGDDFRMLLRSLNGYELRDRLIQSNPSLNELIIYRIYMREDLFTCSDRANIIVDLLSTTKRLSELVQQVEHMLSFKWELAVNDTILTFNSSLRDYNLNGNRIMRNVHRIDEKYSGCDSVLWKLKFIFSERPNEAVIIVNKLYFCLQIQLQINDSIKPPYLNSNVTVRALSEFEFEMTRRRVRCQGLPGRYHSKTTAK